MTQSRARRGIPVALVLAVLFVVLAVTLTPQSIGPGGVSLCIACGERGVAEAILNLLLFVPVGLAFGFVVQAWPAVVAGSLLSAVIEVVQLWVPGRHTTLSDLVFNVVGTMVGVLLLAALPVLLRPTPRTAFALAALWAGVSASILASGLWLLGPALPESDYYGQWTPRLGSYTPYKGQVLRAAIGGRELPTWRLEDSRGLRSLLRSDAALDVAAIAGPRTRAVAPVFAISAGDEGQVVMLAVDRRQVVYRYRTRGRDLGLMSPDLRIEDGLVGVRAGDALHVRVEPAIGGRAVRVAVNGRVADLRLTVADTWSLLFWTDPLARSRGLRALMSAAWLLALGGPALAWAILGVAGSRRATARRGP